MPLRILVVEDHPAFRRVICTALQRRAEFQTIEAADGLEAVQKAEKLQPDLILLAADAAIVLVTESHRTPLLQGLRAQGVDIDGAIERGTYVSFDADVAPDSVRFIEAINGVRQAAAKAGKAQPRVAFCGERAGRLWAEGRTAEAVQLEQLCRELAHDVDILCLYPVPYTKDNPALTRICTEHTAVSAS